MRILVLDTCYPSFLAGHYAAHDGLAERSYPEQWRSIMEAGFGTSDAYPHFLRMLGHDADQIIVNCDPLLRAWAREAGVRTRRSFFRRRRGPLSGIAVAQAAAFEPDVAYVRDIAAFDPSELRYLRSASRLLVGQLGTEPPELTRLEPFDLITTCLPQFVPWLRELGIDAELLRLGFDPRALERVETGPRDGVVFVGSLHRPRWEGIDHIASAAEEVGIDFYGYGMETWPEESPVRRRFRGQAWGMEMLRLLARARIALNRHGDVAGEYAANMRLFEVTGMGAMLITDAKRNLGELFAVDREVVAYGDAEELATKIRYFLDHEDERARIAAAGQRRTLTDHTYAVRMRELSSILASRLGDIS
jgi:hypothetical protein